MPQIQSHLTSIPADNQRTANPARVIAISSGKGGVGKSSLCLSLAVELASNKKKVCVFDADTNLANINIMTGISPEYTVRDFIAGDIEIDQLLLAGPGNISIMPSASGLVEFVEYESTRQQAMLKLLRQLESRFDVILIDTAAGIDAAVLSFIQAASEAIITITPEPTSLTDAFSLLKVLSQQGFDREVQVLVNRVKTYQQAKEVVLRFSRAVNQYLGLKVVRPGYVYDDRNVPRSIMAQKPFTLLYPDSPASTCLKNFSSLFVRKQPLQQLSLTHWFEQQWATTEDRRATLSSERRLWMSEVIGRLDSCPPEAVEDFLAQVSRRWLHKLKQDQVEQQFDRSDGYQAAIWFASRLKP